MKEALIDPLQDIVEKLRSRGGGIFAVVVAKDGSFVKTVYQEATLQSKSAVQEAFTNVATHLLIFFRDDLTPSTEETEDETQDQ